MIRICVPFLADFPYNDEVEEFTIKYDSSKDNYLDLMKFVEVYSDRRINIELLNASDDVDLLRALTKVNSNLYFKLDKAHMSQALLFAEKGLKYFFNIPAINWDSLHSIINAGVSDVYISDELGFSVDVVHEILSKRGIHSRAILNIAQATTPLGTGDHIKAFFIRPEDVELYAEYIDTFELYYEDSKAKLETLYKVYTRDKQWLGDLNEIIADLGMELNSPTLLPEFATYRYDCGKRCYQNSGCKLCDRSLSLSEAMQNKGFTFRRED